MSVDPPEDPRQAAIEQLEQFGLSTYAARSFVGLMSLGTGTAKDVSRVVEVPRTRVYDAMAELQDRGLVDVQQSTPKEFWSISVETAARTFERDLEHRTEVLTSALEGLEPASPVTEQRGVWTVDGEETITARVLELLADAEDEIVFMTVEGLLTDELIDAIRAAAERGVDIKLAGISPAVKAEIAADVDGIEMFESLWLWSDTPAGRLLLVDRSRTLVSVRSNGARSGPGDGRAETAIWGAGETNSLVVVLKGIFTWRLDELAATGEANAGATGHDRSIGDEAPGDS